MPVKSWTAESEARLALLKKEGAANADIVNRLQEEFPGEKFSLSKVKSKLQRLKLPPVEKPEKPELTFEEKVSNEKLRLLETQRNRAEARDVKVEAQHEALLDMIREAVTPLQFKFIPPKPPVLTGTEEVAVLQLGDWHFGKKTSSYNMAIAIERFRRVIAEVIEITALHRKAYPITKLVITWGGDMVDGEGIYPSQPWHTDQHIVNQIFKSCPEIVNGLAQLASQFSSVENYCVRGNHGRISKLAHEDANYDFIFYRVLEMATIGIPNMTWSIPQGWHMVIPVAGKKILLVHGHQIKMTMNLPWYGVTTRLSRWATTEGIGDFDIVHIHHLHTCYDIPWGRLRVFGNGTAVSGDEFAMEFLGLQSSEAQWFYGIRPGKRVTWTYKLDFH